MTQRIKMTVHESPEHVKLRMDQARIIEAFSPTVELEPVEDGVQMTITDISGEHVATIYNGQDYVLTEEDKDDIAEQAATMVDVPVQDVQVNGTSILGQDGVANVPIATTATLGLVKKMSAPSNCLDLQPDGSIGVYAATASLIKTGVNANQPIVPSKQHGAVFYGLAKAAGDTTQSQSANAVGTYTAEAKQAIQTMLGVPSTSDIPTAVSELNNDANYATEQYVGTAIEENDKHFIVHFTMNDSTTATSDKSLAEIEAAATDGKILIGFIPEGQGSFLLTGMVLTPGMVVFNGSIGGQIVTLANMSVNNEEIWNVSTYVEMTANFGGSYNATNMKITNVGSPTAAKDAANKSYVDTAIANVNTMKIHICTAAEYDAQTGVPTIQNPDAQTFYLVPGGEGNNLFIEWAYVNNAWERFGSADVDLSNYVQKTDYATSSNAGLVIPNVQYGIAVDGNGNIGIGKASSGYIKTGENKYNVIVPYNQHESVFYGLAKAAGDSTQSASANAVGTYTDEAKAAIQQMLGVSSAADVSNKADKADTVLDTTLSRGRKVNTTVGTASIAFGVDAEASGYYSTAIGLNTSAVSQGAFAEGKNTVARYIAHAEGEDTQALGQWAHSQGVGTVAKGAASFAGGDNTIANGHSSFVTGRYNVADSYDDWPFWAANTSYNVGDKVKREQLVNNEPTIIGYICKEANTDATFDISHWDFDSNHMNYSVIVGNGYEAEDSETHETVRHGSNAYALDWDGNGRYMGDVYVGANADSTGGTKVATVSDIPDVSGFATKADTVLETTLSRGRKANTTIGTGSFAFGDNVVASGAYSYAEGSQSIASASFAHAEGSLTKASGVISHAEGSMTTASGQRSHAEGSNTIAEGYNSHAEGNYTTAKGAMQHVSGNYNVLDVPYPNWTKGTVYHLGDKVTQYGIGYECIVENSDDTRFLSSNWKIITGNSLYAEIIGNGPADDARSNAYALTWTGDGRYAGDVYVHSNADSTGGTKLATVNDIAVDDVQVNGVSVVTNGVANVPIAATGVYGVIKNNAIRGIGITDNGELYTISAGNSDVKSGVHSYNSIVASNQHAAAFYGLAKAAGADMAQSSNAVGTYTDAAKTAIKNMIGVEEGLRVVRLI